MNTLRNGISTDWLGRRFTCKQDICLDRFYFCICMEYSYQLTMVQLFLEIVCMFHQSVVTMFVVHPKIWILTGTPQNVPSNPPWSRLLSSIYHQKCHECLLHRIDSRVIQFGQNKGTVIITELEIFFLINLGITVLKCFSRSLKKLSPDNFRKFVTNSSDILKFLIIQSQSFSYYNKAV